MTKPMVSVVIPTFGRATLVERAIRSVFAQTHQTTEVIVVIDGDDPTTVATLERLGDPRLRWIVHANQQGAGPARDTGAAASAGEWVAFLDDDDEWLPTKLERQLAAAPSDRPALLMTLFRWVSPRGDFVKPARPYSGSEPIDEWLFDRHSWMQGGEAMLQTSALMAPRALFERLRFRDTKQHEEWELAIRAVKEHGYVFITVPEPLVIYYVPTSAPSLSKTYTWQRSLEWIDSLGDLITPRAYAGFCLTVVTQGLTGSKAPFALIALLRAAFRHGHPTARQLFAFGLIAAIPHRLRSWARAYAKRSAAHRTIQRH
ncbi:glycosyltransferase family 2 protein [Sphingomonas sp. HMP9]|uniref:glycosyltransferase family 2 protein n=1 Tax=Sphingomonas sp. HMP9 TaxID=1517554 RepID=UPI001596AA61|nr:glycosyltransferase family 2 protein [Sphingomonas sp. HMP9]